MNRPTVYRADPAEPETAPPAGEDAAEQRGATVTLEQHGQRLDKLLVALAPEFSRSHLQSLIARGLVQLDGRPAGSASARAKAGQRIDIELAPTDESQAFRPEPAVLVRLVVVHEDEHLLVLDKPAGWVVHPAAGNWSGTLLNGLLARHPGAAALPRAGIVHRLDKDTSGLMVVGKTLPAVTALSRAIAAREVQREYLAIVHGRWTDGERVIEAPIGRDPVARVRMAVVPLGAGGRAAATTVMPVAVGAEFSALRCRLHSGRTHQIRVHLAQAKHPLVADVLYGGRPALGLERQALHAHRLALAHPVTGAALAFEREPPADLAQAWAQVVA